MSTKTERRRAITRKGFDMGFASEGSSVPKPTGTFHVYEDKQSRMLSLQDQLLRPLTRTAKRKLQNQSDKRRK